MGGARTVSGSQWPPRRRSFRCRMHTTQAVIARLESGRRAHLARDAGIGLADCGSGSGGRCEGFALLHDIGDQPSRLGIAVLAASMGRLGRYLEGIASLDGSGRLTLDRKIKTTFEDIGGLDA